MFVKNVFAAYLLKSYPVNYYDWRILEKSAKCLIYCTRISPAITWNNKIYVQNKHLKNT